METKKIGAWIETYRGHKFHFDGFNFDEVDFDIQDIAHSLSMQCRFNGHTKEFYSVAQHSVYVSEVADEKDALWGLLHDATEAYLCDIPKPLKMMKEFSFYKEAENKLMVKVAEHFGLEEKIMPESVHNADLILLITEKRDLMPDNIWGWEFEIPTMEDKIVPLPPAEAKKLFLDRFNELTLSK